jgi:hypothetical protein
MLRSLSLLQFIAAITVSSILTSSLLVGCCVAASAQLEPNLSTAVTVASVHVLLYLLQLVMLMTLICWSPFGGRA